MLVNHLDPGVNAWVSERTIATKSHLSTLDLDVADRDRNLTIVTGLIFCGPRLPGSICANFQFVFAP